VTSVEMPWDRRDILELKLPREWHLLAEARIDAPPLINDLSRVLRQALDAPSGFPPLRAMVAPESHVAVVMDDDSQPTPVDRLAPVLLECLLEAGAQRENITGLFTPKTQEPMTRRPATSTDCCQQLVWIPWRHGLPERSGN
jgi:nickel-dependent lactate racemase